MKNFRPETANLLTATEAREAIEQGLLTSQEMISACFSRIDELEDTIGAWAHLDRERAMEQARQADHFRSRGLATGALHGLPVGIKDIIDTSDYPTERGTVLHQGRKPDKDSTLVSLLREAGATILGKTGTTDLAVFSPGKTTNPHNSAHTPGGSSSGSAAAVSSAMVSLAVGTQTNGSVIRPASYCGIYGFKPTFARISRHGVLQQSRPLDTIGVFARSLPDLALIADVLMRYDAQDESMTPLAPPCIARVMAEAMPADPHIAFIRTPKWDQVEDSTKAGFRELIDEVNQRFSKAIEVVDLPGHISDIYEDHRVIMEADLARSFASEYQNGKSKLSAVLVEMIERGQQVSDEEYQSAVGKMIDYSEYMDEIIEEYDAALTPSTLGAAPAGLDATGNPIMNTIWTLCGTPTINIPLLQSPEDLPVGVQLVGIRGDDAKLFRIARWLLELLDD